MKRKLLKQIAHEWRSNLWFTIELLIVSVVMWYVVDYLSIQATILNIPMSIDTENCFIVDLSRVPGDSPGREPSDTTHETMANSHRAIIDRLRTNPDVEGVGLLSYQSIPYTQNTNNIAISQSDSPDSLMSSYMAHRKMSPEAIRVLRITGTNGESPDEIADILSRDEWLLASNVFLYSRQLARDTTLTDEYWQQQYRNSLTSDKSFLIGARFIGGGYHDSISHRIGAVIPPLKRLEYEIPNGGLISKLDEGNDNDIIQSQLIVRVKPEAFSRFEKETLAKSSTLYRAGNSYLSTVTSCDTMRETVQSEASETVRNFVVIMVFLMVSIFLGLLGTFWFRTQQRVSEIAIRMVNGATRAMVFRRLIGEGLLLLGIATPFAVLCDWLLCHYEMNNCIYGWDFFDPARFTATVAITFTLMALMIVAGIWFPANKAMKTEPAIALKDE